MDLPDKILGCASVVYLHGFPQLEPSLLFQPPELSLSFRMRSPSESSPSALVNAKNSSMPNLASFQGQILPIIHHYGILYRSISRHSTHSVQTPSQVRSIFFTHILKRPVLTWCFRCLNFYLLLSYMYTFIKRLCNIYLYIYIYIDPS